MKTKIFTNIDEVPVDTWEALVQGHSCSHSRALWELVETSGLNDFHHRYVLVCDDAEEPVAFAGFYAITTDVAIFAPPVLRGLLAKVRLVFPHFLKFRMLECGTPILVSSPPFAASDQRMNDQVVAALAKMLQEIARVKGHLIIVMRDFEPPAAALRRDLERLGYHWVGSLPNTYLDIRWRTPEEYVAALTSYYRSKLLKHLRRNREQQVRHELRDDFADLADTLCRQWLVVHEQADEFQREVLNPTFYREFSRRLGERSKVLLFYRGDELVGHALLLLDGDLLRWLYFGRNHAVNDGLYIYVGYAVIETAIRLGARRLELGLTTYSIKQDLGATVTPISLALYSPWRLLNPLVGRIYALLNRPPRLANRRVFKV